MKIKDKKGLWLWDVRPRLLPLGQFIPKSGSRNTAPL